MHGFTCGVDDLILLPQYDIQRKEELEGEDVGEEVHCDFVNFKRGKIGMLLEKLKYIILVSQTSLSFCVSKAIQVDV